MCEYFKNLLVHMTFYLRNKVTLSEYHVHSSLFDDLSEMWGKRIKETNTYTLTHTVMGKWPDLSNI